ncbi:crotonobetainyl-CoA:carnitine CoA-transferase CaiB-like acyl-CoA transferase [Rhizobium sp. PP-F2F-G20b]|nr:crotonobetainyl-CoA:carnitine CoA-transferase CaiB-like acyl-CoA transferase [Rhizobium sp. PP-F2F-G20b]
MTEIKQTVKPLDGIKVLDLARVLAGPLCSAMLADLGATVTKIEIPNGGDDSRAFSPHIGGESSYFMQVNRGKKSVTLDLKSDKGRNLLLRMIADADILVENFRPGVTARLGIAYETVKALNPRLIYVSISGFGQDSPLAHRAAYDHVIQAIGGIMAVTGWPDGPPTRVGDAIGDVTAGIYGSWGALAALLQRERTGEGQHVDVAMLDSIISLQMVSLSQITGGKGAPKRVGNAHPISAPMDSYRAIDGHVVIAVANDALFAKLASAIDAPGLVSDPRFKADADRERNQEELRTVIEKWSVTRTVEDVTHLLDLAGIPAAPIYDLSQALATPHARHRGLLHTVTHDGAGEFKVMPQPVRFSGITAESDYRAPSLGQHTQAVLADELGLNGSEIAGLRAKGVI